MKTNDFLSLYFWNLQPSIFTSPVPYEQVQPKTLMFRPKHFSWIFSSHTAKLIGYNQTWINFRFSCLFVSFDFFILLFFLFYYFFIQYSVQNYEILSVLSCSIFKHGCLCFEFSKAFNTQYKEKFDCCNPKIFTAYTFYFTSLTKSPVSFLGS